MDQYIGKFLDNRYELLEVIGTGGMAVVYKARCHRLNRLVAVKILKADLAQDAEFRRRFHDESQAVAMLSHPNIVAVYDVSHSDDLDYIVMELIDGITLKQYMQKKGSPLNWREALHFITQIVRALSHAHSRGIIHRDIKPHNIMVLRDGSVKVADFGIARLTSAAQSTLTQEALGSVHYISPEQARGSHIDARSDIYSAGVVLYEMITGRLPFEGETPVAIAIQHINSIPLSPRELNPEIPEALEEITMKAMAPNVDERYLNADAMLADLEEFRKNPNINFEYSALDTPPAEEPDEPTRRVMNTVEKREERPQRCGPTPKGKNTRKDRGRSRSVEPDDDDDDDGDDRRGPLWPIFVAVGAIIIFIGVIVWFLWSNFFNGIVNPDSETYVVPNLLGKTIAEVYADPEIEHFIIKEGELINSKEYPAGQVARQDPAPGSHVKDANLTITVDISAGSDVLIIPDVENMERRTALELLRDKMGLVVTEHTEYSDEINRGYAIRTDLPVNTPVERGDHVNLIISDGPEEKPVMLIRFVGQPLEEVTRQIEEMGLAIGRIDREPSEEYEKDVVIWQSQEAGTEVMPKETVIDLKVSDGPPEPDASESPSEEPTDEPTESPDAPPSQPPESTPPEDTPTPPPAPTSGQKNIFINLPEDAYEKSVVQVRIEVDGVVKKNEMVETILFPISPMITGRGTQEVTVYIDDVLFMRFNETFS